MLGIENNFFFIRPPPPPCHPLHILFLFFSRNFQNRTFLSPPPLPFLFSFLFFIFSLSSPLSPTKPKHRSTQRDNREIRVVEKGGWLVRFATRWDSFNIPLFFFLSLSLSLLLVKTKGRGWGDSSSEEQGGGDYFFFSFVKMVGSTSFLFFSSFSLLF